MEYATTIPVLMSQVRGAMEVLRGSLLTQTSSRCLAELAHLEVPWVPMETLRELTYPRLVRGRVIDDALIRDRAAQIVTCAIVGAR
jgi:hypothetical protein